ncbi:hypothetical protein ALC62_01316 [Cyphomyrmex costatus]|uniref:Uncharacterized protein n=1 Tax=Cyphomyrmex costatus TaxID=456900 RepID=A0A195D4H6_9HYME|nr:hypothetical protein ALC62_01316 [Cyphomyrmex costatus]
MHRDEPRHVRGVVEEPILSRERENHHRDRVKHREKTKSRHMSGARGFRGSREGLGAIEFLSSRNIAVFVWILQLPHSYPCKCMSVNKCKCILSSCAPGGLYRARSCYCRKIRFKFQPCTYKRLHINSSLLTGRTTLIRPASRQLSAYLQAANFRVTLLAVRSSFLGSTDESVSTVNKGGPVHPNVSSGRERMRREIRCSWSTSCLTERHDGCNVCLRHGGQRAEQPGGRRRIINHGLGRHMRARCTRLPPSSVDARTDNRYFVTPTLAGDKGLNGRPADARVTLTVMHRRNAPTKSVDLERAAPRRALCPSVYSFFVTKARYSACARHVKGAHTHVITHTRVCTARSYAIRRRARGRRGGDDTFLRIKERRRERDPGVSTRRRDTNSLVNSCLVSIVSRFTVQN